MYYEVYVDFYFLENLFMDYALLVMTAMVMKRSVKKRRIFLAAFGGSISSCLLLLLPVKNILLAAAAEVFVAVGMTKCSFENLKGKLRIKAVAVLYLLSFLLGGTLQILMDMPYFPLAAVQAGAILILGILLFLYTGLKRHTEALRTVTVTLRGQSRELQALLDTGNRLREPYRRHPVNILEYEAARELLGEEEAFFLIPCRTVNGSSQLLEGMVFDKMSVSDGRTIREYEHPVIAFTKEKLSSDDSYQMILHPENSGD